MKIIQFCLAVMILLGVHVVECSEEDDGRKRPELFAPFLLAPVALVKPTTLKVGLLFGAKITLTAGGIYLGYQGIKYGYSKYKDWRDEKEQKQTVKESKQVAQSTEELKQNTGHLKKEQDSHCEGVGKISQGVSLSDKKFSDTSKKFKSTQEHSNKIGESIIDNNSLQESSNNSLTNEKDLKEQKEGISDQYDVAEYFHKIFDSDDDTFQFVYGVEEVIENNEGDEISENVKEGQKIRMNNKEEQDKIEQSVGNLLRGMKIGISNNGDTN